MLKRLHLKNFTVFADADFEFSPGLNVLVGTNGTGKSHVLKVGYAIAQTVAFAKQTKRSNPEANFDLLLTFGLSTRFSNVFLPGTQNKLVRNSAKEDARIVAIFDKKESGLIFRIVHSEQEVNSTGVEQNFLDSASSIGMPVFIPAKEILSLMPDIVGISEKNPGVFDSTYSDLAKQLTIRAAQNPTLLTQQLIASWADLMSGTIQSEDGRFYFHPTQGGKFRVGLAAEGFRKLGTLIHLLANDTLAPQATLFWDEPEANLNPALLRKLAAILAELARQGFQIILATHSMSLLKEFHILSREKEKGNLPIRYFGLNARPGHATTIIAQDDFEYLPDVVALDVELQQADKLEEIFAREDREAHANNH